MQIGVGKTNYLKLGLPIVLFLWGIFQVFFGEQILANQGLGWDGARYASLTSYLTDSLELDNYLSFRILVPAFVNFIFNLFGIHLTTPNIILAFNSIHLILIPLSGYYFVKILEHYELKTTTKILAVILCFVNFAIIRFTHYYPVMLDSIAFSISIFILYLYIKNRTLDYLLLGVIGAFIFPTLLFQSICLYVFNVSVNFEKRKTSTYVLVFLSFVILQLYFYQAKMFLHNTLFVMQIHENVSLLSIFISSLLATFLIQPFVQINFKTFFLQIAGSNKLVKILVATFILILILIISNEINSSNKSAEVLNSSRIIPNVFLTGNILPAVTFFSHSSYFGAIVILILFFAKSWIKEANQKFGLGYIIAVLGIVFVFGIGSETRRIINILPWLIVPLVLFFDKLTISKLQIIVILFLNLFASKIWLTLNTSEVCQTDEFGALGFPCQKFLMNLGPWMSYNAYWILLIFFLIFTIIILLIFRKTIFTHGKQ